MGKIMLFLIKSIRIPSNTTTYLWGFPQWFRMKRETGHDRFKIIVSLNNSINAAVLSETRSCFKAVDRHRAVRRTYRELVWGNNLCSLYSVEVESCYVRSGCPPTSCCRFHCTTLVCGTKCFCPFSLSLFLLSLPTSFFILTFFQTLVPKVTTELRKLHTRVSTYSTDVFLGGNTVVVLCQQQC